MITEGKIVLFCGKDINRKAFGDRDRYGGGIHWKRTESHIRIHLFWRYADIGIPADSRLHLFGTTPENTIGCIVIESIQTPQALLDAPPNALIRTPIDILIPLMIELEYAANAESFDDAVIDFSDWN